MKRCVEKITSDQFGKIRILWFSAVCKIGGQPDATLKQRIFAIPQCLSWGWILGDRRS
jgi:hypothetical protein